MKNSLGHNNVNCSQGPFVETKMQHVCGPRIIVEQVDLPQSVTSNGLWDVKVDEVRERKGAPKRALGLQFYSF